MATDRRIRVVRFFRVAGSTACVAACVVLIASWVRSYRMRDTAYLRVTGSAEYLISQANGQIFFFTKDRRGQQATFSFPERYVKHDAVTADHVSLFHETAGIPSVFPKAHFSSQASVGTTIVVPHWSAVLLLAAVAALPWIPWPRRFSLRSLFIGISLAAVVLGIVVYATG